MTTSYPFAVILCRYKEYEGTIPNAQPEYFKKLFVEHGSGGVADYWRDVSGNKIDFAGSQVYGWYYLPHSRDEEQAWIAEKKLVDPKFSFRYWRILNALEVAAANKIELGEFYGAVAIYEYPGEVGGVGTGPMPVTVKGKSYNLALTILDPGANDPWGWKSQTVTAHEIGHALGLEHSFRYLGPHNPSHKMYGDPWDIMSADAGIYKFSGQLGESGPALSSVYQYTRGWLDNDAIWQPANGQGKVELAPLYPAEPGKVRVARIPGIHHLVPVSGAGDLGWPLYPAPGYLLLEFRSGAAWDAGLETPENAKADDVVLIHWGSNEKDWINRSVLLPSPPDAAGLRAGDHYIDKASNLRIDVLQIQENTSATIEVGPAPSLAVSTEVETHNATVVATGNYEWPGVPGYCSPKSFAYSSVQQQQTVTVTAGALGLQSPVTLSVSIGKKNLNNTAGTVMVGVQAQLPDTAPDSPQPYKKVAKTVELSYERQGNVIRFTNQPKDGTYTVGITVKATDSTGVEAFASTVIPFHGWVLNFSEDYAQYSEACLMVAIANHLKEITKTIPAEQEVAPSPMAERPDLSRTVDFSRWQVATSANYLQLAATGVYGPLFEEVVQLSTALPWSDLGWQPGRVTYRIPSTGRNP